MGKQDDGPAFATPLYPRPESRSPDRGLAWRGLDDTRFDVRSFEELRQEGGEGTFVAGGIGGVESDALGEERGRRLSGIRLGVRNFDPLKGPQFLGRRPQIDSRGGRRSNRPRDPDQDG